MIQLNNQKQIFSKKDNIDRTGYKVPAQKEVTNPVIYEFLNPTEKYRNEKLNEIYKDPTINNVILNQNIIEKLRELLKINTSNNNFKPLNKDVDRGITYFQEGGPFDYIPDFENMFDPRVYHGAGGDSRRSYINQVYNEHLAALNKHSQSAGWSQEQKKKMAKFLTAHKVAENGWVYGKGGPWAGYGKVTNAYDFINGMFKNYRASMLSNTWNDYVRNLRNGVLGAYNSENKNYYNDLINQFGPGSRVWGYLDQI